MIINDFLTLAAINLVSAGIVALVCILVMVFAILASKTWHWANIVLVILTTIAGVFAATGMASVYKQRTDGMKAYNTAYKNAIAKERQLQEAISGDILSPTYDRDSLRYVDEVVSQYLIGRGRTWSGNVELQGNVVKFKFPSPREMPANDEAENADLVLLKDYMMFAFLERQVRNTQYPGLLVGTFRVIEETADELTLELVAGAAVDDAVELAGKGGLFENKWTLFEKMPQDRRDIFRDAIISLSRVEGNQDQDFVTLREQFEDPNAKLDISLYRKILQREFLPAQQMGYEENSREYERLVDNYAFDGLSLGEIEQWLLSAPNRISKEFTPPPESVFIQYEFTKDSNTEDNKAITVDGEGAVDIDGLFTPSGASVVAEYKNNKDVEFKKGDRIFVDQSTATGVGSNLPAFEERPVVEVGKFYFRQLNDFPLEFKEIKVQRDKILDEIARITAANQVQAKANADAKAQIANRTALIADSEADQISLNKDLNSISQLRQQREAEFAAAQQTIASLENEIQVAYDRIRETIMKLSRQAFANR